MWDVQKGKQRPTVFGMVLENVPKDSNASFML